MIYTVNHHGKGKQTYEGIKPLWRVKNRPAPVIAVVFLEDTVGTWWLDPKNEELALSELHRYYRSEYAGLEVDIVIYKSPILCLTDTGE